MCVCSYVWTGGQGHLIFHVRACVEDHPLINSIGSKFSSQGHFHSLQLLNVSQILFSGVVRLQTAPRGNFSHAQQIRDSDHTHQLAKA